MNAFSAFKNARVLVTGHTGFKGSWLCLWLHKLGAEVYGISDDIPSDPSHFSTSNLSSFIHDLRLDLRDTQKTKQIMHEIQPQFVFHLAAQPLVRHSYDAPIVTWQINTMATINVLDSLRSLPNLCVAIFITSDKCYDNSEWVWGYRETDPLGGPDPYSASKGAAELAIRSYVRSFFPHDGLIRIGVGRAGNVIGGGDWAVDRIVPDCVRAWSQSTSIPLRNPLATRPWQHVLEPLSGYLNLAVSLSESSALHGQPFNFGPSSNQNYSVGELVDLLTKHWPNAQWNDVSEDYGGPHESSLLKLNCDKALQHLRWWAVWDFADTVRETALWYRNYYDNSLQSTYDFSMKQIDDYSQHAQSKGLSWSLQP